MKFCVIANPEKYSIQEPLIRVVDWCRTNKSTLIINRELLTYLPDLSIKEDFMITVESENKALELTDIVIALGGDGTMLHTAHLVKYSSIPVLGVNTGRLGFMANIQPSQIEDALDLVLKGKYSIDKRDLLQATSRDQNINYALNEFLFSKKDTSSMISLTVEYDGVLINNYWADGLLVSSPSGSTAYNLSAGGPIVLPGTPVMLLTPINPHTLTTRSLVLPSNKILTVKTSETPENILFSYDGIEIPHNHKLDVEIKQSEYSVHLIQLPEQNYFETLRNKLMWGMDKRKS
ncbi:MAG: NAD(+)/NADH kinase [Balneolaceae bacterium]